MTHHNNQLDAIFSATHFAAEKHVDQKRKGKAGEPYINHLIEVAQLDFQRTAGTSIYENL